MSASELFSEALKLSVGEREAFANQLWDSVEPELQTEVEQWDIDPEFQAELERRVMEIESGAVTPVDAFAALAEVRRRFQECLS